MKVIVGLGNPGLRYRFSRHNLGFLVVEKLAKSERIRITRRAFNCLYGQGAIGDREVILAKPCTFVNLSGQAVNAILKRARVEVDDLLVVCDDINLSPGEIRIRGSGSDGGHNGLRSIIEMLGGNQGFARLRIGIGNPAEKGGGLSNYVLGHFSKREIEMMNDALGRAVDCCKVWVEEGINSAMNKFNKKTESKE